MDSQPRAGGDINDAYAVELSDGRAVFVKSHRAAEPAMFPCEARGLRWLAEADAIRIPAVLAVSDADAEGPYFLALELLTPARRVADYDQRLGRGLAALHRSGAPSFGLDEQNFIATLPQDNRPCPTWAEFYATRRLLPQVRLAIDSGRAPATWAAQFDQLAARLDSLVGPPEPPARLHGDLWGGNLHVDSDGAPALIDPAVYGGHREVDLAMLALFGGASQRVYDAYDEAYPLDPGWAGRVPLYQLYPLLVHVNLFGLSYGSQVERALARYR
ncbi:MAG: fructosamine kinase family protein [Haliangiales bacterium]